MMQHGISGQIQSLTVFLRRNGRLSACCDEMMLHHVERFMMNQQTLFIFIKHKHTDILSLNYL